MSVERKPATPRLDFFTQARVTIDPPQEIGVTGEGTRRIINITGGNFSGEKLSGTVLRGGADWQLVRPDGVVALEARYTVQTNDGALIYVCNRGLIYKLSDSTSDNPAEQYYMRTTPIFETGDERYRWLNNIVAVCSGVPFAEGGGVILDFYAVL